MTLIDKIIEAIKESDHEVVLPLIDILDAGINQNDDFYIKKLKRWMDDLQEMYDKAERVDDLENSMYYIDELVNDAENSISEIRGYTNV
tara:strand:+ start:222 stop:488 length:267 start_codon:yes stop_codon:yes gene_type:complete